MNEFVFIADGLFAWYESGLLNNNKDAFVAGTLEISTNGISTLKLMGILSNQPIDKIICSQEDINPEQWIIGYLKTCQYVFLRQIKSDSVRLNDVLPHQVYQAYEAVVLDKLDDLERLPNLDMVAKLRVDFNILRGWASEAIIKVEETEKDVIICAPKSKIQNFGDLDKKIYLNTNIQYPRSGTYYSITIKQEIFFEIEPEPPFNLQEVRKKFRLLEDIILLLSNVNIVLPWPIIKYDGMAGYYYFKRHQANTQKIDFSKSWVRLSQLTTILDILLSNLEKQKNILGPGLYLYLGIRRNPSLYLENKFLMAIFGLESLHRKTSIDDSQNKSNQPRSKNKLRLKDRLFSIFSELQVGFEPKKLYFFSKECADFRNQIAHFGGRKNNNDYEAFIQKMYILNEAVQLLYHAVLLQKIGLNASYIMDYFHKMPYSGQYKRILNLAGLDFVVPNK